jgi:eukaryotic-like serine/threonine-protein kinase
MGSTRDLSDDDTRGVLQTRLALVFTVLSGVALFYALSYVVSVLLSDAGPTAPPHVPFVTLAIGVGNGLLALRCRRGRRSLSELRTLDAGSTSLTCWMIAGQLAQIRPANEASISLQLSMTYVLMARAVLLPSSGRRTLLICAVALVPSGLLATWLRVDALGRAAGSRDWLLQGWVVFRNFGVTAFLATLASQVIYGLRKQVRESARVGQYVLRAKLGEGGMGAVYRATHALLRRDTAVKLLLPSRLGAESVTRFEREVKLTAQLTHPNTVAVFDYGRTPDGVFYYAMEHLEGGNLEELVSYAGPLSPARVVWILEQVCRALSEAHALGMIHRDVKPSNVLLCERGREGDVAKILDFGLVKDLNASDDARLTQNQALTGTPLYLSPESIASPDAVGAQSDIYSLGAVAHFLLVGAPPFAGATVVEVCAAHLHVPAVAPSQCRPGVSPVLDAVILRCLEKQPNARFRSAHELRDALLRHVGEDTWNAERAARWWQTHRDGFRAHCDARRRVQKSASDRSIAESDEKMRIDFQQRSPERNG